MLGKIIASSSVLAVVVLVFLLQTTTPASIGPLGILLIFMLMYMAALGMLTFLILAINRFISKIMVMIDSRRAYAPISLIRAYYFASVMALAPVMIIGMQSVAQVGAYEFSLVVLFLVIACIYISKRTR